MSIIHPVDPARQQPQLQQRLLRALRLTTSMVRGRAFLCRGLCSSLPVSPHSLGTDLLRLFRQVTGAPSDWGFLICSPDCPFAWANI